MADNSIVPQLDGDTIPDFLGKLIREYLDQRAAMWDTNASLYTPILDPTAEAEAAAVVAYIRDPLNVNYTIPAYVTPPPV